jgi:hypothetical protein
MILYHFTDFYYLETGGTILKEGLKPDPSRAQPPEAQTKFNASAALAHAEHMQEVTK